MEKIQTKNQEEIESCMLDKVKEIVDKRDSLRTKPLKNIALEAIVSAAEMKPLERGKINFTRIPGKGKKGELWLRNSLIWLRTIPLEKKHFFINFHAETPIYLSNERNRNFSADLVGLSYKDGGARFCVVELKAGDKGDNLIYAITEGAINLFLLWKNIKKLRNEWETQKPYKLVWKNGNPFSNLEKRELIILGDSSWWKRNEKLNNEAKVLIREIKNKWQDIDVSVFSFTDKVKLNSKPYVLLNIEKKCKVKKCSH